MGQNETERHFENLDRDMEKASRKAGQVVTKEAARRMAALNWKLLITLVGLIALLVLAIGGF